MGWNHTLDKGSDLPTWEWLSMPPVLGYNGSNLVYDGFRFMYYAVQFGTTSTTAGSTELWRYDTINDGWMFLATLTSTNSGCRLAYDRTRNIVIIANGNGTNTMQVFNPNYFNVTVFNQSCNPVTLTNITFTLPTVCNAGASLITIDEVSTTTPLVSSTITQVASASDLRAVDSKLGPSLRDMHLKITSGSAINQVKNISTMTFLSNTPAYPNFSNIHATSAISLGGVLSPSPSVGDTFQIQYPQWSVTSATTSVITFNSSGIGQPTTNAYRNMEVLLQNGNRYIITANSANTITVSGTLPTLNSGDIIKVVRSNKFIYFNSTVDNGLYQVDITSATPSWSNLVAPNIQDGRSRTVNVLNSLNSLVQYTTGSVQYVNLGTYGLSQSVISTPYENFFSAGTMLESLGDLNMLALTRATTTRIISYSLNDGFSGTLTSVPYATHTAYDGQRMVYVKTPSGDRWLYYLRPGGQEFYRLSLDYLA